MIYLVAFRLSLVTELLPKRTVSKRSACALVARDRERRFSRAVRMEADWLREGKGRQSLFRHSTKCRDHNRHAVRTGELDKQLAQAKKPTARQEIPQSGGAQNRFPAMGPGTATCDVPCIPGTATCDVPCIDTKPKSQDIHEVRMASTSRPSKSEGTLAASCVRARRNS